MMAYRHISEKVVAVNDKITKAKHEIIRQKYRKEMNIDKMLGTKYYMTHPDVYRKLSNSMLIEESDVAKHINAPWDWGALSKNILIRFAFIMKYKKKSWDWAVVSTREDLDFGFVDKNYHLGWDKRKLLLNKNITHDFLWKRFKDFKMFTDELSACHIAGMFYSGVIQNRMLWNYDILSGNESVSFTDIFIDIKTPWNKRVIAQRKDLDKLFESKRLTEVFILDKLIDMTVASGNKYISDKYIFRPLGIANWNWKVVSRRDKLDYGFILKNYNLDWDWRSICNREDFPYNKFIADPKVRVYVNLYMKTGYSSINYHKKHINVINDINDKYLSEIEKIVNGKKKKKVKHCHYHSIDRDST